MPSIGAYKQRYMIYNCTHKIDKLNHTYIIIRGHSATNISVVYTRVTFLVCSQYAYNKYYSSLCELSKTIYQEF